MRTDHVIVIGAGMGGLSAAIFLAKAGFSVTVVEARAQPGGLASGFTSNGIAFDAGPYILLDRQGLQWAFEQLDLDIERLLRLKPIEEVYSVSEAGGERVRFFASLDRTAQEMEQFWPGSGERYRHFVRNMQKIYHDVAPMLSSPRPNPVRLLTSGARHHVPFLLRSLAEVLADSKLPRTIIDAIGIWIHIAGQSYSQAPAALAFVPALIHGEGCYYPDGGTREIPRVLAKAAEQLGVEFLFNKRVARIRVKGTKVTSIVTADGDEIPTSLVMSDCGGLNTYLMLLENGLSRSLRRKLNEMPLQSPGVCAYLSVKGKPAPPYLRFHLPGGRNRCRLLIRPSVLEGTVDDAGDQWQPARLVAPMDHYEAEKLGHSGQAEFLASVLHELWWKENIVEHRLLATRTPRGWGQEFHLYRDSMNPVMTAQLMRRGRMEHRSPYIGGLYLSGSSTHPGQWVSFCAISGVLSAKRLLQDVRRTGRSISAAFPSL